MIALPQNRLNEPWVEAAVAHVSRELLNNRNTPSDCGPVFHALHGLVLYRQRTNPEYRTVKPTSENQIAERGKPRPVATRPIAQTIQPAMTPSVGVSTAAINPAVAVEQAPVTKVLPAKPADPITPMPMLTPAATQVAITPAPAEAIEPDLATSTIQLDESSLKNGEAPVTPLALKKPASIPAVANDSTPIDINIDAESGKAGEVAELPYSRQVPAQPR